MKTKPVEIPLTWVQGLGYADCALCQFCAPDSLTRQGPMCAVQLGNPCPHIVVVVKEAE